MGDYSGYYCDGGCDDHDYDGDHDDDDRDDRVDDGADHLSCSVFHTSPAAPRDNHHVESKLTLPCLSMFADAQNIAARLIPKN